MLLVLIYQSDHDLASIERSESARSSSAVHVFNLHEIYKKLEVTYVKLARTCLFSSVLSVRPKTQQRSCLCHLAPS